MVDSEVWREIPGLNRYEVSNFGMVRSWCSTSSQNRSTSPRVLRIKVLGTSGHCYVAIKNTVHPIRLLVGEAFVSPFCGDRVVHVDGNAQDNSSVNLQWAEDSFVVLPDETWRKVNEFYDVSNWGRVRSWQPREFRHRRPVTPRLVSNVVQITGYFHVNIGGGAVAAVHRLVAGAFLGECPDGYQVRHKNHDRSDNSVSNLQYCTGREKLAYSARQRVDSEGHVLPVGVYDKGDFYQVTIVYEGRQVHLGCVDNIEAGARLRAKALDQVQRGVFRPRRVRNKLRRNRGYKQRVKRCQEEKSLHGIK